MKLLLDENLSPRLVQSLSDVYLGSAHVQDCGLGASDDAAIWEYAKANGFLIVSKDSDFQERSVLMDFPPKVVWLRAPNCTSTEIAELLRNARPALEHFAGQTEETCLVLRLRTKTF